MENPALLEFPLKEGLAAIDVVNAVNAQNLILRAKDVTVARLDARLAVENVPVKFATLVGALNAMLERFESGFQHLSRFTSDLAHDRRTPIANMRGSMEVALSRPRSTDEYEPLLASILEEYERLSRMIENVPFLARAGHLLFVRHMREFDVGNELTWLAGYFEGLTDEAGSQRATLRIDSPDDVPPSIRKTATALSRARACSLID